MPVNASNLSSNIYASSNVNSSQSPILINSNHYSNTNPPNPVNNNTPNQNNQNPWLSEGNQTNYVDSTAIADALRKVFKINSSRPEIIGLLEFLPLSKDLDASDALFNYNLNNGEITSFLNIDATSATLLLEKQSILRDLTKQSINEIFKYYGARDIHLFLTSSLVKQAIMFNFVFVENGQTSLNNFKFEEIESLLTDSFIERIDLVVRGLENASELQIEEGQETDLLGLQNLTTGNLDSASALSVLSLTSEYTIRLFMTSSYLVYLINYFIFKDYTKNIMRMR